MDSLISYFNEIPTTHRSMILFGGLTIFLLLENFFPVYNYKSNKTRHVAINILFTFTTVLVNFLMAFILIKTSFWVEANEFGLLHWIQLPIVVQIFVGLLFLDFIAAWLAHYTEHHVKWMWQFHVIHHTDMEIDASTANRHHPGESVVRFTFTIFAIFITGASFWLIMLYQAMSVFFGQLTHTNIKIPSSLNTVLKLLFVTPQMHRVHHHYRQPYSDSNYGNIFSLWDRLFGTYRDVDNSKLVFGLDTHFNKHESENVWELLKIPFKPYRAPKEYPEKENL